MLFPRTGTCKIYAIQCRIRELSAVGTEFQDAEVVEIKRDCKAIEDLTAVELQELFVLQTTQPL